MTSISPATAAQAATAARTGIGLSTTGMVGVGAGVTGLGLTLIAAVREALGNDQSVRESLALGPGTYAIGAGMSVLLLTEHFGAVSPVAHRAIRAGSLALIMGGLAGSAAGTIPTFYNPHDRRPDDNPLMQPPHRFEPVSPETPGDLRGIELATAEIVTSGRSMSRVPVYIDTASAQKVEAGTLDAAIVQARKAAQADELNRSQAVVQTRDGALWTAQLSGDADQIDGRYYTKDTDYDPRYPPTLVKRQPALQAVVGVESRYTFPAGATSADAAPTAAATEEERTA